MELRRPCTICDEQVDTALAIDGSAEWFCAVMEVMGLTPKLALALLQTIVEEHASYGSGKVMSRGKVRIPDTSTYVLYVCEPCAAKAKMVVSNDRAIPCYKEPDL